MYINFNRIPLPWGCFKWWGGHDRSGNGDHIFDVKCFRIRVNLIWGSRF